MWPLISHTRKKEEEEKPWKRKGRWSWVSLPEVSVLVFYTDGLALVYSWCKAQKSLPPAVLDGRRYGGSTTKPRVGQRWQVKACAAVQVDRAAQ